MKSNSNANDLPIYLHVEHFNRRVAAKQLFPPATFYLLTLFDVTSGSDGEIEIMP
jgi:hypothetical protein